MSKTLISVAGLLVFSLSGCISFGGKSPSSLLTLTSAAQIPVGTARSAGAGQAIILHVPDVPAALASNRIPVQSDATNIAYVKDGFWVEAPNRLFRRVLAETITAKTGKLVLDVRQYSFEPGIQISGELLNFGVDAGRMQAVLTYDANKLDAKGTILEERRFEARIPISEITAHASGDALNKAANQIADEVANWVSGNK